MCEHARSAGIHDGHNVSPLSSPGMKTQQFPTHALVASDATTTDAAAAVAADHPGSHASSAQFYRRVYPTLRNLFLKLQGSLSGKDVQHPHTDDKIAEVSDLLEQLDINDDEWKDFARFDGKHYTRNLIAHDSNFTVLLLCWNKAQRSPIHSHSDPSQPGQRSSCWVKVMSGHLRERRFAWPDHMDPLSGGQPKQPPAPSAAASSCGPGNESTAPEGGGMMRLVGDATVGRGGVCYINDTQALHEMGNPCDKEVCVSLHVYSPPFYSCYAFNELDQKQCRVVSMLAATAPPREVLGPGSPVTQKPGDAAFPAAGGAAAGGKDKNSPTRVDESSSSAAAAAAAAVAVAGDQPKNPGLQASNTPDAGALPKSVKIMQNLHLDEEKEAAAAAAAAGANVGGASCSPSAGPPTGSISLIEFCRKLDSPSTTEAQAVGLFSKLYLGKAEWSSFVHFSDFRYQRLMLHTDHRFSLLMLCWLKGQSTPPHNHKNSRSYVRVLAGELFYHEVDDDGAAVESSAKTLSKCSTADSPFVEDDSLAVHVVGNRESEYTVSLHLYSPPYTDLTFTTSGSQQGGGNGTPTSTSNPATQLPPPVDADGNPLKDGSSHQVIPYAICQQMLTKLSSENVHKPHPAENCSCNLLSNFFLLQEKLGMAFGSAVSMQSLSVAVLELLEEQMFSPQELEQYWAIRDRIQHTCRVHDSEVFCVSLNLWAPEHSTTIHDHGADSLTWCKVLDGSLIDTLFEESDDGSCLEESNTSRLVTGSVTFYGTKAKHSLSNPSKTRRAISLHVYCSRTSVLGASSSQQQKQQQQQQQVATQRLLPWGMQQGARWYTRSHPKQGIRVMSVTAVEDINWRQEITTPKKRWW